VFNLFSSAPPGRPQNIGTTNIKSYEATIKWDASTPGTSPEGHYAIKCTNCPTEFAVNTTSKFTNITMEKLAAYANYTIQITKENDVTRTTGETRPGVIQFRTLKGG